jgi:hypothetical protein
MASFRRSGPAVRFEVQACSNSVDYTYESSDRHYQTAFAMAIPMKDGGMPLKSLTPLAPGSFILRAHPTSGH